MLATLTSKGQITLPKALRDALNLDTGTKLNFSLTADGGFLAQPVKVNALSVRGLVKSPHSKALTRREEQQGVAGGLRPKYVPESVESVVLPEAGRR